MSGTSLVVRTINNTPTLVKESLPLPEPETHQALIKVSHVAQNPTDVQSFDINAFGDGTVLGCDFVGKVVKIGRDVSKLKEGDVIAGLIWGGEIKGLGAYSEYTLADENICFKLPSSIKPEQAATVPLAAATAWLALFSPECLNIDRNKPGNTLLIWGGSSSVGLYAIQIAALYKFQIITTCSPKHFDLVRSLGAQHVFDYRDEDVVDKIKAIPGLTYIFDTIGSSSSSVTASQTLSEAGGVLCTVRPGKVHTENVTPQTRVTDVLVWTAFLKDHQYKDFHWPASPNDHTLAKELFNHLPHWLETGALKPNKPSLLGGLDSVTDGFQSHRDAKISGYKLVYQV